MDEASEIPRSAWQPDAEAKMCSMPGCERLFSMLYRRHHCRKCGRVVCSACSKKRIEFLDHDSSASRGRTERVCRECCQLSTLSEEINSPIAAARAAEGSMPYPCISPITTAPVPPDPPQTGGADASTPLAAEQQRSPVLGVHPHKPAAAAALHTAAAAVGAGRCEPRTKDIPFFIHAEV